MAANNNEGEPFMGRLLCFFWRHSPRFIRVAVGACDNSSGTVPCKRVETDHVPAKI
jgi:hypothetical protein